MSLLANLKTDEVVQEEGDRLGGGNFGPWDTGVYKCKVAMAYTMESKGGAAGLVLHLTDEDGRELRQTLWMSSGKAKGQKPFYVTQDGERKFLPGYILANHLCLLTAGKEIHDMVEEQKIVKLWNAESKSEQPTQVDVLTELLDKEIYAAVYKQIVDKNVQDASGNYVPSGETREENELEKFFRARDRMTVAEIKAQELTEGAFIDSWAAKHGGNVKDKSTKPAAGATPAARVNGASAPTPATAQRTSLFAT